MTHTDREKKQKNIWAPALEMDTDMGGLSIISNPYIILFVISISLFFFLLDLLVISSTPMAEPSSAGQDLL
jgi:hypothetical protein